MLKNFGYGGAYHDTGISVSVMLENPLEYGFDASELAFSVALRDNIGNTPILEDFTFYVMDEFDQLYNTRSIPFSKTDIETPIEDNEPVRQPDGLIFTEFKHSFLFHDLRIVFYYRPYRRFSIIELKH